MLAVYVYAAVALFLGLALFACVARLIDDKRSAPVLDEEGPQTSCYHCWDTYTLAQWSKLPILSADGPLERRMCGKCGTTLLLDVEHARRHPNPYVEDPR